MDQETYRRKTPQDLAADKKGVGKGGGMDKD